MATMPRGSSDVPIIQANTFSLSSQSSAESARSLSARLEEKLRETVATHASDKNVYKSARKKYSSCVLSEPSDSLVFTLIVSDVVVLLCGVQLDGFDQKRLGWTSLIHSVLLIIFTLEASARIVGELLLRRKKQTTLDALRRGAAARKSVSFDSAVSEVKHAQKESERLPLSTFVLWDTVLLVAAIVGAYQWGLKSYATILPSMLRTCRMAKLTNPRGRSLFLKPLELLLSTIYDARNVLFFSFFLQLLNVMFFAVLAMGVLQPEIQEQMHQDAIDRFGAQTVENCRYAFSSLFVSTSTLFALSTGDQWHDIALPIIYYRPWAFLLFMTHTVLFTGIIIGLVYSALCETLQRYNKKKSELDDMEKEKARQALIEELSVIFDDIDGDKSGYITWQEFQHNRKNNVDLVHIMEKLDLEESELLIIWDVMDTGRDGRVSKDEFVKFMWKVLFDGGKWTKLKTMHCAAQANFRAEEVSKYMKDLQDELSAHRRLLEKLTKTSDIVARNTEFVSRNTDIVSMKSTKSIAKRLTAKDISMSVTLQDSSSVIFEEETEEEPSAFELMRGVEAYKVSQYGSTEIVSFWSGGAFIDKDSDREFNMSRPVERCDFFVSHCWNEPDDWYKFFRRDNRLETYGYTKAVELHNVLMGHKRTRKLRDSELRAIQTEKSSRHCTSTTNPHRKSRFETTCWVDKCCIPQNDKKIKASCVKLLEEFMNLSDGFIVILSWQYFTRLWCVYEWACFLRTHNAACVHLGFDAFLRSNADETLPQYLDSIQNLSVKGSQCFFVDDHEILEAKVFQYYNGDSPEESFASFERFAKCTAISLMAKQLVLWRARGSTSDEDTWLGPFRVLADTLGFDKLAKVLRRAEPAKWYSQSNKNQEAFDDIALYWFDNDCVQYLMQERARAVRKSPLRFSDASAYNVLPVGSQVSLLASDEGGRARDWRDGIFRTGSMSYSVSSCSPYDPDGEIVRDEHTEDDEVELPPASLQPNCTPRDIKPTSIAGNTSAIGGGDQTVAQGITIGNHTVKASPAPTSLPPSLRRSVEKKAADD